MLFLFKHAMDTEVTRHQEVDLVPNAMYYTSLSDV